MRATRDVEKSISIMAMFPSSLLKILENGSVWNILNPFDVPVEVSDVPLCAEEEGVLGSGLPTNS